MAKDLSKVLCPPYDVISPTARNELYDRDLHNIIRIILSKDLPGDTEFRNKYTRAEEYLKSWRDENILIRDSQASIYAYEQEFSIEGKKSTRRGFMALVKIEDQRTGSIYPHEATLPKKREDRLRLMRACRANLSPIFALYPEEKEEDVYSLLRPALSGPPEMDLVWDDGSRNRAWSISDWATIESVSKLMEKRPLFIADGHHRYEVATTFGKEVQGSLGGRADYVMMMLVSMNDPGLFILPIHRLVRVPEENPDLSVVDILEEYFYIEPQEQVSDYASLNRELAKSPDHIFGLYVGSNKKYYLLSLANDKTPDVAFKEEPKCFRRLDTRILHGLVLDKILGEHAGEEKYLTYVHDAHEAIEQVNDEEYDLAFFLKPTTIEQVKDVASERLKMPPKTTFFHPKLLTGLVINCLDNAQ